MNNHAQTPGSETELFHFIHDLDYADLPAPVVHKAKCALLDTIAVMLAGRRTGDALGLEGFMAAFAGSGRSTVAGTGLTMHSTTAAFVNAAYAQVHDFNDGLECAGPLGGAYHPGRVLVPTALAVGEQVGAGGRLLLCALVAGYDVASRVRNRAYGHRPVADAYGAASVAARLLGASVEQIGHALGMAGYLAPHKNDLGGLHYNTDFLANGAIAQVSVQGALLAERGMSGPPLDDNPEHTRRYVRDGLGRDFDIMTLYLKPYPTCRKTHGAIDMALAFRDGGTRPETVRAVRILQHRGGMYIDTPVDARTPPHACEFNILYPVACAFVDGRVDIDQFVPEQIGRDDLQAFIRKISVRAEPRLDADLDETRQNITEMEVDLRDGRTLRKRVDHPLGDAVNPLSEAQIEAKLADCAGGRIPGDRLRRLADAVWSLEALETPAVLFPLMVMDRMVST